MNRYIVCFVLPLLRPSHFYPMDAKMPGDLTIGAIFPIHAYSHLTNCGTKIFLRFVVQLEAFFWSLDYVNQRGILPGFKLGGWALDICDSSFVGTQQNVKFMQSAMLNGGSMCEEDREHWAIQRTVAESQDNEYPRIVGVVGPAISAVSVLISPELSELCIPLISTLATSTALDNDKVYNNFLRTVPSDRYQAEAVFEFLRHMNWTLVSLMYEETTYGESMRDSFISLNGQETICIAHEIKLAVARPRWKAYIEELCRSSPHKPHVLLLFAGFSIANQMFEYVRNELRDSELAECMKGFQLVGSDGWSRMSLNESVEGYLEEDAITVEPLAAPLPKFYRYLEELNWTTIQQNSERNPWLREVFMQQHNCCLSTDNECTNLGRLQCNDSMRLDMTDDELDAGVTSSHYIFAAVNAFAPALNRIRVAICGSQSKFCDKFLRLNGSALFEELKAANVSEVLDMPFTFYNGTTSGPPHYTIFQHQKKNRERRAWVSVAIYKGDDIKTKLIINPNERINCSKLTEIIQSVKSCRKVQNAHSCPLHQRLIRKKALKCCWECEPCEPNVEIVNKSSQTCQRCEAFTGPNSTSETCIPLPREFLDYADTVGACFSVTILLGALLSLTSFVCMLHKRETALVRAGSGRWTTLLLPLGVTALFVKLLVFLIVPPSESECVAVVFVMALSFTVCTLSMFLRMACFARMPLGAGPCFCRQPIILVFLWTIELFICLIWYLPLVKSGVLDVHPENGIGGVQVGCWFLYSRGTLIVCIFPWTCVLMTTACSYHLLISTELKFVETEARNHLIASSFLIAFTVVTLPVLCVTTSVIRRHTIFVTSVTACAWCLLLSLVLPKLLVVLNDQPSQLAVLVSPERHHHQSGRQVVETGM